MNKKGNEMNEFYNKKGVLSTIKNSYIYKLFRKLFSVVTTLLLIVLLAMGGMMFYFNMQGRAAAKQGKQYIAPFGLYTIVSGSMEPKISVYDVVTSVQVDDMSSIKIGDVITFISTWELNYGVTVTHRVVDIIKNENGDYSFLTKGDANEAPDGAYVTRDNLIGRVVFRLPQLGRIQFFLATKTGWFIVVFVPALAVIIWDILKIFRLKVLKSNIGVIDSNEIAKKQYSNMDILDSRDIDDMDLQKTTIISRDDIINVDKKTKGLKNNVDTGRKPLPKRKTTITPKISKTSKKTNNK